VRIVTTISHLIQDGFRRIKAVVRGKGDVQTPYEVMPFGVDAVAPQSWRAVYSETGEDGKSIIIGYFNLAQLDSLVRGEHRIYSTDTNGVVSTSIYLRGDGTMEVGGATDFMVRYNELETAFNQLKTDRDDTATKLNALLTAIQTTWVVVPNDGGAALKAAAAGLSSTSSSTADITPAKIEEIKTL